MGLSNTLGGTILLHGHKFLLTGGDDFALKFMEAHPELFGQTS